MITNRISPVSLNKKQFGKPNCFRHLLSVSSPIVTFTA